MAECISREMKLTERETKQSQTNLYILKLKSIKETKFYIGNIPCIARLSGMTSEFVFNRNIDETVL